MATTIRRAGTNSVQPWYELKQDDDDLAERIFGDLSDIKSTWGTRLFKWDRVEEHLGTRDGPTGMWNKNLRLDGSTLTYSVLRSVRDAMRARLSTRRPKIRAFTSGARYTVRERARQITKQMKGIFARSDVYRANHQVFNDVLDYGIGYHKPFEVNGQIRIERVHPRMVVMDEPDYGAPTEWFHFFDVRKSALIAEYEEHEDHIMRSSVQDLDSRQRMDKLDTDWTTVAEAWHCPQSGEGRHVISVNEGIPLVDDDWKSTRPGIVPNRFFEPNTGFVGHNLMDLIGDLQDRVYYLLGRITDQMDLGGTLKILIDAASGLNVEVLSNELIQILKHNGTKGVPAQIIQIPAIDPVYFQELDRCEGKAYSIMGMSELWASSEKPKGLSSGRAINEMDDITSTRFLDVSQKEDAAFVDLGRSCLALACSVPGFKITINGAVISWKDIELDEDEYDLTIAPVSMVPDSSPGKIQQIIDDSQLDAQLAADQIVILDSIDHEAYIRQLIAPKLACEKYLDEIFYDHKDRGLDENLDLAYLDQKRVLVYNQAYLKEDEEAMTLLITLQENIKSAKDRMQQAAQPIAAPSPLPLPVEGAPPEPGGTSPAPPPGPMDAMPPAGP
jgi:hypothetical protein